MVILLVYTHPSQKNTRLPFDLSLVHCICSCKCQMLFPLRGSDTLQLARKPRVNKIVFCLPPFGIKHLIMFVLIAAFLDRQNMRSYLVGPQTSWWSSSVNKMQSTMWSMSIHLGYIILKRKVAGTQSTQTPILHVRKVVWNKRVSQ